MHQCHSIHGHCSSLLYSWSHLLKTCQDHQCVHLDLCSKRFISSSLLFWHQEWKMLLIYRSKPEIWKGYLQGDSGCYGLFGSMCSYFCIIFQCNMGGFKKSPHWRKKVSLIVGFVCVLCTVSFVPYHIMQIWYFKAKEENKTNYYVCNRYQASKALACLNMCLHPILHMAVFDRITCFRRSPNEFSWRFLNSSPERSGRLSFVTAYFDIIIPVPVNLLVVKRKAW